MKTRLLRNSYCPSKPLLLPKGTTIQCEAHLDNSSHNRANADPTKVVRWGPKLEGKKHYDVYSGQCLDDVMKLEIPWFDKYLKKEN